VLTLVELEELLHPAIATTNTAAMAMTENRFKANPLLTVPLTTHPRLGRCKSDERSELETRALAENTIDRTRRGYSRRKKASNPSVYAPLDVTVFTPQEASARTSIRSRIPRPSLLLRSFAMTYSWWATRSLDAKRTISRGDRLELRSPRSARTAAFLDLSVSPVAGRSRRRRPWWADRVQPLHLRPRAAQRRQSQCGV